MDKDERSFRTPFAGYDVLDKWDSPSWNDATRKVVGERLRKVPERCFFTPGEWRTLAAVCARILPQPDRPDDPVPIVPWIDARLSRGEGEGYRYADLPPAEEAWRKGLRGIEEDSAGRFGREFADLSEEEQDDLLRLISEGQVTGPSWADMTVRRFFTAVLLKEIVGTYYAHPAAWSEIGFGGPASPRGYVRLKMNQRDSWEAEEQS